MACCDQIERDTDDADGKETVAVDEDEFVDVLEVSDHVPLDGADVDRQIRAVHDDVRLGTTAGQARLIQPISERKRTAFARQRARPGRRQ